MEVALQDDAVFVHRSYYARALALRQARELGVSRLRINVYWARVTAAHRSRVPESIRYSWAAYDQAIDSALAFGFRVQLTLSGPAPAWATGNGEVGPYRPNPALFEDFARAAATHFAVRVDRYSIWNEPNYSGWLAPLRRTPYLYRALYLAGRRGIHAADPTAHVLIGETAPYAKRGVAIAPLKFLRALACVGRDYRSARSCEPLVAEGYAHHPYDFIRPIGPPDRRFSAACRTRRCPDERDAATLGTLARLSRALSALARVRALTTPAGDPLELYLTEYGYFAVGRRRVPEALRARYLRRAFQLASGTPGVRQLLQYMLVSPPTGDPFNTGVVCHDGQPTRSFREISSWARNAARRGAITRPGPIGRLPRERRPPRRPRVRLPAAYPAPPQRVFGC